MMIGKRSILMLLILLFVASMSAYAVNEEVKGKCMTCHKEKSPGLYHQWRDSEHAAHNVTCYDCHGANRSDADAYMHEGAYIATLVTPNDCAVCHKQQSDEFQPSHHAKAGQILDSNDAYLAHVVGGNPVAIVGCESCHGAKIQIDKSSPNKLAAGSWPNSGIGRLNPDGSVGSCNACHVRHTMSLEQARQPETCGKCHLGPDHPQKEIYEESKHGIEYFTNKDDMNLDADPWIVGQDYYVAPTCATCHLSGTKDMPVTHDAGARLSWNLRAPVSKLQENWDVKRSNMQNVCQNCHGGVFYKGHYTQLDGFTHLYNEKFAKPSAAIMGILKENKSMPSPASFSNDVEWIYWEIWHHEGRRARHGASMMGPDYAWWHGIYEVGQHFYFKFIPAVRELEDEEANAYIDNLLANDPMHVWMSQNTADLKDDIKTGEIQALYEDFFQPVLNK